MKQTINVCTFSHAGTVGGEGAETKSEGPHLIHLSVVTPDGWMAKINFFYDCCCPISLVKNNPHVTANKSKNKFINLSYSFVSINH